MMPGPMELAVIAGVALLIFGPRQIPRLGRALGDTIREFRGVGKQLQEGWDDKEGRDEEREVRK